MRAKSSKHRFPALCINVILVGWRPRIDCDIGRITISLGQVMDICLGL